MTAQGLPWVTESLDDQQIPAVGAGESLWGWSIKMQEQKHTHMADSLIFCLSASLVGWVSAIRDGLQYRERLRELKATGLISERQEQDLAWSWQIISACLPDTMQVADSRWLQTDIITGFIFSYRARLALISWSRAFPHLWTTDIFSSLWQEPFGRIFPRRPPFSVEARRLHLVLIFLLCW